LLSIIPATLLIASLWPLYHWWAMFTPSDVVIPGVESRFSSIGPFFERSIPYFFGIIFLLRNNRERIFLLVWAVIFALISMAVILPLSPALLWVAGRFADAMRIPLVIGIALGLGIDIWSETWRRSIALPLVLVMALSIIAVSIWRTVLRYQSVMSQNAYEAAETFVEYGEEGDSLIALPAPGYNLMGMGDYNVYSIDQGHDQEDIVKERNAVLNQAYESPDVETWKTLLTEYDAELVLTQSSDSYDILRMFLNGKRLNRNNAHELYVVDPDDLDMEVWAETPDPALEESSIQNGYTWFDHWADLQIIGRGDIQIETMNEGENAEPSYLRFESGDPRTGLLFVNRGYIEVESDGKYSVNVDLRSVEGVPNASVVLYQYDESLPDHFLRKDTFPLRDVGEDWESRSVKVGNQDWKFARIPFEEDTRFVKVGVVLYFSARGRMDLGRIELLPFSRTQGD
jgi:hypothetical protein